MLKKTLSGSLIDNKAMDLDIEVNDNDNEYATRHTNESAIALSLEYKMSKGSYNGIYSNLKDRGCHILPCY